LDLNPEIQACNTAYPEELKLMLSKAYDIVEHHAAKARKKDAKRYNTKLRQHKIEPGDIVLVRNVGPQSQHKLAPRWDPTPYVVMERVHPDSPVYRVKPEHSSKPVKTLHRNMLLPFAFMEEDSLEVDITEPQDVREVPRRRTRQTPGTDEESSDTESLEEDESDEGWLHPLPREEIRTSVSPVSDIDQQTPEVRDERVPEVRIPTVEPQSIEEMPTVDEPQEQEVVSAEPEPEQEAEPVAQIEIQEEQPEEASDQQVEDEQTVNSQSPGMEELTQNFQDLSLRSPVRLLEDDTSEHFEDVGEATATPRRLSVAREASRSRDHSPAHRYPQRERKPPDRWQYHSQQQMPPNPSTQLLGKFLDIMSQMMSPQGEPQVPPHPPIT
jgi:hypothetical protein